jgi:hypothetical protein
MKNKTLTTIDPSTLSNVSGGYLPWLVEKRDYPVQGQPGKSQTYEIWQPLPGGKAR